MTQEHATGRHRVVIVGGGFGGLYCAQGLRRSPVEVTLIDRRNFHLFQPLLYQVATGALSPANIATPLRCILSRQKNCVVRLGEVVDLDPGTRRVVLADGARVPFDTLVLATGSIHHYFGNCADWEPLAPGLKTVEDATEIRRKRLAAFARAELAGPDERRRLLTFVVVGGGPTGVEMAGAVRELASHTLARDFRFFDPAAAQVVLVESQPRVLAGFHEQLSRKAGEARAGLGVEMVSGARVTGVARNHVIVTDSATRAERRIDHGDGDGHLGGRGQSVAAARSGPRPTRQRGRGGHRRPGLRHPKLFNSWPPGPLCGRRQCSVPWLQRTAAPRRGSGRHATGRVRSRVDRPACVWQTGRRRIRVPRQGEHGDDRPVEGGGRYGVGAV